MNIELGKLDAFIIEYSIVGCYLESFGDECLLDECH
jgi:hypothetical protein